MARNNHQPYKVTKNKKLNTKWLNNVMRSIGSSAKDEFKSIAPSIYSVSEGLGQTVNDAVKIVKGNNINTVKKRLTDNKYVGYAQKAIDNVLDDLKTGNINNKQREEQYLEKFMGADELEDFSNFFDGDEYDDSGVTFNYYDDGGSSDSSASLNIIDSVQRGAEANIKAQKATVDAMISISSATMLQNQQLFSTISSHLGNINNGISALLRYHEENTTRYYEAATAVFDKLSGNLEEESYRRKDPTANLFDGKGKMNVGEYKKYVKKQIVSAFKDTELGSMADMIFSDDSFIEMAVSNPLGFASNAIVRGMVPHLVTNTIKGMEEAFSGFMPTMLAQLGDWRKNEEIGWKGELKRFLGKSFGISTEMDKNFDFADKVTKDAAVFDGVTRNTIVEVIPKHLREMTSYLKAIAEKQGIDTSGAVKQSQVYDSRTGGYIAVDDIQKNIGNMFVESIDDAFNRTEFGKAIRYGGSELKGKDRKSYDKMASQMFQFISRMDSSFTPADMNFDDKNSVIHQIFNKIDADGRGDKKTKEVLMETVKSLLKNNKAVHTAELGRQQAIRSVNSLIDEISDNPEEYNAIAGGLDNNTNILKLIDEVHGNKQSIKDREANERADKERERYLDKREYKTRMKGSARRIANSGLRDGNFIPNNQSRRGIDDLVTANATADNIPGFIASTGNHLKDSMFALMRGDSYEATKAFSSIFSDSMKTLWGTVKDGFLTPLKESIFGKKDENGFSEGGLFSGLKNNVTDIWKEIGFRVNGKSYVDSKGETHKTDNPEDSIIGKASLIFKEMGDSIKYRLFGKKNDETSEEDEGAIKGLIGTFKEGIKGWKDALFGSDDPEESADEIAKDLKEKALKAIPDLGIGALGGAAVGSVSGGLLGTLIGGPIGGMFLGMGTSLLSRSNKFKDYLFGPEVEDEKGNVERVGGLISKKFQDMFKNSDMKKSAIGGAAIGFLKNSIMGSSGGLLGSIVGGPIAGALVGTGLGILKESDMFKEFMYGNGKDKEGFKNKLKKNIGEFFGKNKDKNDDTDEESSSIKKKFGMGAIGAMGGGIMGMMLGGPIIGSLVGLATGVASSGKKFRTWLFGKKDKDGNVEKVGMVGKLGNFLHTEVMAPIKSGLTNMLEDAKLTLEYKVFKPLEICIEPLTEAFKETASKVKNKIADTVEKTVEKFIKPIKVIAENIIFKPIRKVIGFTANMAYKVTKSAVLLPVKILTTVTKIITHPFKKLADKVGAGISKITGGIKNVLGGMVKKFSTGVSDVLHLGAALSSRAANALGNRFAGVGKETKYRKRTGDDSVRGRLKNTKIDFHNEMLDKKKKDQERKTLDKNRQTLAKAAGYDVKYFTEENLEKVKASLDDRGRKRLERSLLGGKNMKFEESPEDKRKKMINKSNAELADANPADMDIETRGLQESVRQTGFLEKIWCFLTGKKPKYNKGDSSDSDGSNTDTDNKKDGDTNTDNAKDGEEAEKIPRYQQWLNEMDDAGGFKAWMSGKWSDAKESISNAYHGSDLQYGVNRVRRSFNNVKNFFSRKGRTRADGGDMEAGQPYMVGEGGSDPSAAEIVVPKWKSKVLSQRNGGIKVNIVDIDSKVKESFISKLINSIKSLFKGGSQGSGGLISRSLSIKKSNIGSKIKAIANSNSEAEYDENGNLIEEQAQHSEDATVDDIIDAENASDLNNARNVGSYETQKRKKEQSETAEKQQTTLDQIKEGQEEGNKEQKKNSNFWSTLFSKKGIIGAALIAGAVVFKDHIPTLVNKVLDFVDFVKPVFSTIANVVGGIGSVLGVKEGQEVLKETVTNATSGNVLQLNEDGTASSQTGSAARAIGRRVLNWSNRGNKKLVKEGIDQFKQRQVNKLKSTKVGGALVKGKETIDTVRDVGGRILHPVKYAKKQAKNQATKIRQEAVGQVRNAVDDKLVNPAKSFIKNKADDALAKTISTGKKAVRSVAEKAAKDDGVFSKVCGFISKFFKMVTDKFIKQGGAKKATKSMFGEFTEKFIKETLEGLWGKAVAKLTAVLGAKAGAAAASLGLSEVCFAALGGLDGATGAAKLFKVPAKEVDGTMILVSSILGVVQGTTVGSIVDIVFSIIDASRASIAASKGQEPPNGILTSIATSIYKALKGDAGSVNLDNLQKAFKAQYSSDTDAELKKQYNTQIRAGIISKDVTFEQFKAGVHDGTYSAEYKDFEDYNVEKNGSMSDKAFSAIGKAGKKAGHWLKSTFVSKDIYTDKNGNKYTKSSDGMYEVTDASGKSLGKVSKDALPKDATKETRQGIVGRGLNFIKDKAGQAVDTVKKEGLLKSGLKLGKAILKNKQNFWIGSKDEVYVLTNGAYYDSKGKYYNANGERLKSADISKEELKEKFDQGLVVKQKKWKDSTILKLAKKNVKSRIDAIKFGWNTAVKATQGIKTAFEKVNETWEKLKEDPLGTVKSFFTSTKKTGWMSPEGDYYTANRDGTWNHYSANGSLMEEKIPDDDVQPKIKNGTLVSTEVTEKSGISKAADSIKTGVTNAWNTVSSKVSEGWNKFKNFFTTGGNGGLGGFGDEFNGFKYFSQNDARWKDTDYSANGAEKSGTIGKAGCGPTAMAMVASQLNGSNLTPVDIARDAQAGGYRDETGTNANFIGKESSKLKLSNTKTANPSADYILNQLDQGKPMILNGMRTGDGTSAYTRSGHYVVAVGRDKNGNILINDPRGKEYSKAINPSALAKETRIAWAYDNVKTGGRGPVITFTHGGYGENTFTAQDVVKIANGEIGYEEKASAKDLDKPHANKGNSNHTKYEKEVFGSSGNYWCASFVSWCFYTAANKDKKAASRVALMLSMSCETIRQKYVKNKRYDKSPKVGDMVFFTGTRHSGANHIGIVTEVNGDKIKTVEGNTSSQMFNDNGGVVAQHEYPKDYSKIMGYGHPNYDGSSSYNGSTGTTDDSSATTESPSALEAMSNIFTEYSNRAMDAIMGKEVSTDFSNVINPSTSSSDTSSSNISSASVALDGDTGNKAWKKGGKAGKSDSFKGAKSGREKLAKQMWNYLTSIGFSEAAAAGVIGNAIQESGINPLSNLDNNNTKFKGIFQLSVDDRFTNMKNWSTKHGLDWKSAEAQTRFAVEELVNTRNPYFKKFVGINNTDYPSISDPKQAAHAWVAGYEGAHKGPTNGLNTQWQEDDKRQKYAQQYYNKFKKGGSGGFGDGDIVDYSQIFNHGGGFGNKATATNNTTNSIWDKVIENGKKRSMQNEPLSTYKLEQLLAKVVEVLGTISEATSDSRDELKNISTGKANIKTTNTTIIAPNNSVTSNNVSPSQSSNEGPNRNLILAKELARG